MIFLLKKINRRRVTSRFLIGSYNVIMSTPVFNWSLGFLFFFIFVKPIPIFTLNQLDSGVNPSDQAEF